jgi:hypothetical protein
VVIDPTGQNEMQGITNLASVLRCSCTSPLSFDDLQKFCERVAPAAAAGKPKVITVGNDLEICYRSTGHRLRRVRLRPMNRILRKRQHRQDIHFLYQAASQSRIQGQNKRRPTAQKHRQEGHGRMLSPRNVFTAASA